CAAPSISTWGAWSDPMASSATRITSGVLDLDPLLALVVAAGGTHPVRLPQIPALGTGLEGGHRGLVVRAPRALLAFGRSALRDSHTLLVLRLSGQLVLQPPQRRPAGIGHGGTVARSQVQVTTAAGAEPLAVLSALQKRRGGEHQFLAHRGDQIDDTGIGGDGIAVGVVC